MIKATI